MRRSRVYHGLPILSCSWTSVVKGAVLCEYMELGNTHLINTRLSRWNYGIPFRETYDPNKHREEDRYPDPFERPARAKNQICWLVKKVSIYSRRFGWELMTMTGRDK
jgi:hypothetical protein